MPVPRLVLHIGAAKTATTYIQHGLFDNEDFLREHGVYIPKAGRFDYHPTPSPPPPCLGAPRPGPVQARYRRLGRASPPRSTDVDADTVLVSSESLERMSYSPQRRGETAGAQLPAVRRHHRWSTWSATSSPTSTASIPRTSSRCATSTSSSRSSGNALQSGNFNLDKCFRDWYESDDLILVAIPFADLVAENPLFAILKSARIDVPLEELALSERSSNESLGPIGVEACRLLGSYLRDLDPSFTYKNEVGQRIYRLAAARARKNGWSADKFWGWEPEMANGWRSGSRSPTSASPRPCGGPPGRSRCRPTARRRR